MSVAEQRLLEKDIVLPEVSIPLANYVPGLINGNMVYTSGQLPMQKGQLKISGKLGENLEISDGYEAAKICVINCLGVLKSLIGDLDRVERVVKVVGYVNSTSNFTDQPKVVNGASELLELAFGDKGSHARSAVGVASLPLGAACEIELIVQFK